jgi:GT2 family glycosyltransferase
VASRHIDTTGPVLFILPTYSHFEYAGRAIESFQAYTPSPNHVLVVDDNSPDWHEGLKLLPKGGKQSRVHFDTREGLTRSWNCGLKVAQTLGAGYVICGNSDIVFTPDWFRPLKESLEKVDLVGPLTNAPGHCPYQYVGLHL